VGVERIDELGGGNFSPQSLHLLLWDESDVEEHGGILSLPPSRTAGPGCLDGSCLSPGTAASTPDPNQKCYDGTLIFPERLSGSVDLKVGAKYERVALVRTVDEVAGNLQLGQDPSQSLHIVADLFRKERGLSPGPVLYLVRSEEAMRMIEEELE
jgi:hypothetical protein